MILFFDTETTGLPRNWKAPVNDLSNWPRLVQLAWLEYDQRGELIESKNFIIQPEGYVIPSRSSDIHGITHSRAVRKGVPLSPVLQDFNKAVARSELLVAHNMSFDEKIVGAELLRTGIATPLFRKERFCTMKATTAFCAIPGKYGYKWPTLSELHIKLFDHDFDEAHNAAMDIEATARCFWELHRNSVISIPVLSKAEALVSSANSIAIKEKKYAKVSDQEEEVPELDIMDDDLLDSGSVINLQKPEYAGFWLRAGALMIDMVIANVIVLLLTYLLADGNATEEAISALARGLGLLFVWLYFALFESSTMQATPGKQLLDIKVTNINGNRIGFGKATGRHFAKILSVITVYIGFIMAGFTQKKQALHDMAADTLVVKQ